MRKLLLLMFALLTGVSGAWADESLPASTWNISSALPTDSWVAMGDNTPTGVTSLGNYTAYYRTQVVTLETAGMLDINFLYSSGSHRLEILGVDALNASNEVVASDYHFGYTGTFKSVNDYFLNGLSAGTYTLRYIINSGVSSSVGNITIRKFEADVVSSLPQLTTDVNNPKYYSIGSYNRGGYLTSNGADQSMTHVDFAAGSSWYFTAINGNNSGTVIGGVIAHCSDGTQMNQNWQTAASGQTIYILPNGYNTNGFCLSKTLPISSNSCCDANNYNTGLGNWYPRNKDDWQGTTWVFKTTVPIGQTGYYYFKGMATDRYPYLYSNFVGKSENNTYHHSPLSGTNGEIWKVTNNGTTFTLTNGEGLPLTIGSTTYETLTLSAASAGPDYYFTEAINLTTWGNDTELTTWAGHPDATDNKWTFELVDVSAGVYNVVVQGNDDGYVTYSGQNAKNGGFFVASSITEGNLTAKAIDGYTTSISISDRTITVSYNQQISYTLTDANGATYSWSAPALFGVAPTLSGCAGYSLSNEEWNEGSHSYSANITFPFAVSSNDIENYTFIGQFNNKNGYSATEFLWHVNGTSIIIHSGDLPTTEDSDHDKYLWSIIPAFSNGAFTFTIKNKSTGTYVNSTCTENRHNVGDVTFSETATPMTYNSATPTGTCSPINAWYLPSTSKYLSANSVSNEANAVLGVWGSVHDGISTGFPTYGDLISIYWSSNGIAAKIAKAGQCGYPSATNEYIVALNGVETALNGGSYPSTANSYNNLRTWYEGALSADVVLPTAGKFYRFKGAQSGKYLKGENSGTSDRLLNTAGEEGAKSIFYLDASSHLLGYSTGQYVQYTSQIAAVGAEEMNTFEFEAPKTAFGALSIKASPSGNNNGRYLYSHTGTENYANRNGGKADETDWYIEEVTALPVSTTSNIRYATFCSPVEVSIPGQDTPIYDLSDPSNPVQTGEYDEVTAFQAKIDGDDVKLVSIDDGVIPANFPVVLKMHFSNAEIEAEEPMTKTRNLPINYGAATHTAADYHSNALEGTIAAITVGSPIYTLQYNETSETVGFYRKNNGTLKGFKAYLSAPNGARFQGFSFEELTGISAIIPGRITIENAYDLQGRRAGEVKKGVYIVNGKKVLF